MIGIRTRSLVLFTAIVLVAATAGSASELGEYLDCSDWIYFEPGLSCTSLGSWGCEGPCSQNPDNGWIGVRDVVDNEGRPYRIHREPKPGWFCGSTPYMWTVIQRYETGGWVDVARAESRCVTANVQDDIVLPWDEAVLTFDAVGGRLIVSLISFTPNEPLQPWIAAFEGFTRMYDILQTYDPGAAELGFRVPALPEGLPGADRFDTYFGDLATVGDWSQLQPLRCDFPTAVPASGDYLTVLDTTLAPPSGTGWYFVTAVTHQGVTRFGRQAAAGQLTGRDPTTLPACTD